MNITEAQKTLEELQTLLDYELTIKRKALEWIEENADEDDDIGQTGFLNGLGSEFFGRAHVAE